MIAHELDLAEEEFELHCLEADVAANRVPEGVRRAMYPHELDSRINFVAIANETTRQGERLARTLVDFRSEFLALLLADISRRSSASEIAASLQRLPLYGISSIPQVPGAVEQAESIVRTAMTDIALTAAASVQHEAALQGVTIPALSALTVFGEQAVQVQAARVVIGPHLELAKAVTDAVARLPQTTQIEEVLAIARRSALELSVKPLENLGRQAAASSIGIGRVDAPTTTDLLPRRFASELLDSNTCTPCERVDGTEYFDELSLRHDYPRGIYVHCEGIWQCRGTPLYVWSREF